MIFSIKPQIFELKCVFSYFRLKTHITLLLPVYVHSWEQRKLGEVAKYRNGKAHENCIDESGKYIVVNSKFVSTNGTVIKHSNMQNEPLAQNEIAFVLSDVPNGRAIARTFLVEENDKYTLNQRIAGITSSENTYPYFLHILMNRHPYFLAFDDGVKQTNLSVSDVLNFETYYPEYEEQKQIGEYFRNLDRLITLHQRKCQIDGCRFQSPLAITWEQRKLGDCFTERVESMPDGELISVTINDGIKKFSELGRHDNSNDDKSKYKKVCIGDIAYNSMRMWQGASGYSPYEGIVSPAYTVLSPNSGINSKCLAYQFKLPEMIHTFQINSQGITSDNWNLKYPALSEIEIFVSRNEKEQAKISEYFERLDRLITLHQCE